MYANNPYSVKTFGVGAVLVATDAMKEEEVYEFVKAVFGNLENFKTLHPVFATLDAEKMKTDSGIAPLHKGAKRYLKKWLQRLSPHNSSFCTRHLLLSVSSYKKRLL